MFNFGDSPYYGSLGANPPTTPIVDLSPTTDGAGYTLIDAAGQIFTFGNAPDYGGVS